MESAETFVLDDLAVAPHLDWSVPFCPLSYLAICTYVSIPAQALKFIIVNVLQ